MEIKYGAKFAWLALAIGCCANAATAVAAPPIIPVEEFVKHAEFSVAKISPNGEYLAMTTQRGEQDALVVLSIKDMAVVKMTQLPNEKSIGAFYWVGSKRLMFTAVQNFGRYAAPFSTGEWYAMDADGSRSKTLVSYGAKDATRQSQAVSYYESFDMLDPLPENETSALMSVSRA